MNDPINIRVDTDGFEQSLDQVRTDLSNLVEQDLNPLAAEIRGIFKEISETMVSELADAAQQGKLSIKDMVNSIITDIARLAADEYIREPIKNSLLNFLSNNGNTSGGPTIYAPQSGQSNFNRSNNQTASLLARGLTKGGSNG